MLCPVAIRFVPMLTTRTCQNGDLIQLGVSSLFGSGASRAQHPSALRVEISVSEATTE